jgi:hypothetical protein
MDNTMKTNIRRLKLCLGGAVLTTARGIALLEKQNKHVPSPPARKIRTSTKEREAIPHHHRHHHQAFSSNHHHLSITLLNQSGVLKPPNLALALSIIPSNCSLASRARSSHSIAASYDRSL